MLWLEFSLADRVILDIAAITVASYTYLWNKTLGLRASGLVQQSRTIE